VINMEHEVVVDRPPSEVFAYVIDADKLPEWQEGVIEARKETEGPVAAGTRFTEVRKFLGRRMESSVEVTEFEPDRTFTLKTTAGPVPFTIAQHFEPANGGTRIRVTGKGEPGGFFKVAEPLVGRQVKRFLEHSFATLKDLLESGGAPDAAA
jgi:uncharacterized protein YndB with AHSA1/START domain